MELKIADYIIRPDNGNTFSIRKVLNNKKTGEVYESEAIYPRDITNCIMHIRNNMRREDSKEYKNLHEMLEGLKKLDAELKTYLDLFLNELKSHE